MAHFCGNVAAAVSNWKAVLSTPLRSGRDDEVVGFRSGRDDDVSAGGDVLRPSLSSPSRKVPFQNFTRQSYLRRMRAEPYFYVYILASRSRILYIGVTSRIEARLKEHRTAREGFSARYRCHRLVLLESYPHPLTAIAREKQLKRWNRGKKIALIESVNPFWSDLSAEWGKPVQLVSGNGGTTDLSTPLPSGRDDEVVRFRSSGDDER